MRARRMVLTMLIMAVTMFACSVIPPAVKAAGWNNWGCPSYGGRPSHPTGNYACLPERQISSEYPVPPGWVAQGGKLHVDTSQSPFSDVPVADQSYPTFQLAARGVIRGYGDGRLGSNDLVLRAQMAAMIVRAMGWDAENHDNMFTDQGVVDADLWRNVGTLAHYDVARGYGDGTFGPTDNVLNIQVIAFVTRAMVAKEIWQLQPDNPALYANVPVESGHRVDVATFVYYAGDVRGRSVPSETFSNWDQAAPRSFLISRLWAAMSLQLKNPPPFTGEFR